MAAHGSSSNRSPRSLADATRFTSNTPHAKTKAAAAAAAAVPKSSTASTGSRSTNSRSSPHLPGNRKGAGAGAGAASRLPPASAPMQARQETLDERVRRLRAAHLAAKQHNISRLDRILESSRRTFDAVHKFSIAGLIGFSTLALFAGTYAAIDMMMLNRKRRNEFFAMQKQMKEDSLESARLAYMTGTATEEQIALVEEATAKANQAGMQLPSLLSAPQAAAPAGGRDGAETTTERAVWPGEAMVESSMSAADETGQPKKKGGLTAWLFSGLKKEESREDLDFAATSGQVSYPTVTKTVDEAQRSLQDKAKVAFEQERENQRRGGPLDQLGLDDKPRSDEGMTGEINTNIT
ncbi:hypothetical protein F4775DRAFT_485207 [Biscogniauxia sp. FL1348]|nr:hypothetical protein F4775DRAFT_485207 [Biscogniauxia sp. FL1348]